VGTTVADKEYDGTTDATITLGTVNGIIAGDDVTVTPSGAFPAPDVGVYQVTVSYALSGAAAGYYIIGTSNVENVTIYDTLASDGYTVDYDNFNPLDPGTHVVIGGESFLIGSIVSQSDPGFNLFNAYTNGFKSLSELAGYLELYNYQEPSDTVTINIVTIAPGADDTDAGITLWRDDADTAVTQVWTGTVLGNTGGGQTYVKAINVIGNTTWDNQSTIYVGESLDINYDNTNASNILDGRFVDGYLGGVVNIGSAGKDIFLSMANFAGAEEFTGDFNVVADHADFTGFEHATPSLDANHFTRTGFLNLGGETNVNQLFIQIGDTAQGLVQDTNAAVRLATGGNVDELMVQIDAYLDNGYTNTLCIENDGTIGHLNFSTSSSMYDIFEILWPMVMGGLPVPTEQELYYYYYDGETAASNPFNTGSDENITAFLATLQAGGPTYQHYAEQIVTRMKGMHDVADATSLYVRNDANGVIGSAPTGDSGLEKLWAIGGVVYFENVGILYGDVVSTDGQGADNFLNNGGTMAGFYSGSTNDTFVVGGGSVNGDISVGAGDDQVAVFDTFALGGEIVFGDGEDTLSLYGSAYGAGGTTFSGVLADTPEHIVIYNIGMGYFTDTNAETTVMIDVVLPNTDVTLELSQLEADRYGEYGVALGQNANLMAIGAYTVKLDAATALGNGQDKIIIFSGVTKGNINMDAEFTFVGGAGSMPFAPATLTIGGDDRLVIGGREYSLLCEGTDIFLQRGPTDLLPNLYTVSVTAVDKYTAEELVVDGGTITSENVAQVTVTYGNNGEVAVPNNYFYSAIRVKNVDTGEYILKDSAGNWYERYSVGLQEVGATGSFKFLMPRLAEGNYVIQIQLDNREVVEEISKADNYTEVFFSVSNAVTGPNLVVSNDSFSAVDEFTGDVLDIANAGISTNNNARVTVTYWNTGDKDVSLRYFYNEVRVYGEDGTFYVMDSTGRWYERLCDGFVAAEGGSGSFSFLMPKLAAGKYFIHVILDHRGVVTETDETDNEIIYGFEVVEGDVPVDLVAESISAVDKYTDEVIDINNDGMTTENTAIVTVTYRNVGTMPMANDLPFYSTVRVWKHDAGDDMDISYIILNANGDYYDRVCAGGLDPGETGTFSFLMPKLAAGDYVVEVIMDSRGMVEELGEGCEDNTFLFNFTVSKPVIAERCDMVNVDATVVDKITGMAVERITTAMIPVFTISYTNQGNIPNPRYFYSSVQVVRADGTVILDTYERYCAAGLAVGDIGTFNFTIGKQAVGSYTVKVQLDNREALDQVSYDNDYAEYTFEVADASDAALPDLFADEGFVEDLFVDF
ncbi:MAG: YDG domain-containing protein, partial [Thermoguttaceae bacterium]